MSPDSSPDCPTPAHPPLSAQTSGGGGSAPQPQPSKLTRLNSDHAIYPTPRPSSLPSSSSLPFPLSSIPTPTTEIPRPPEQDPLQRYSSASLPPPHQIPFHALPRSPPPTYMGLSVPPSPRPSSPTASSSANLRSPTLQSLSALRSQCSDDISSSSSSSSSVSASTNATTSSRPSSIDVPSCSPTQLSSQLPSHDSTLPPPRPVSPPTPFTLSSRLQSSDFTTAMRRFISPSHSAYQSLTTPPQSESSYPPPPDPPLVLPADPPDDITQPASNLRSRAPYMPFLSNAPPPPDCWIQVETSHGEYRLNVRLPGFSREGITLATKRRRILHVVADSWENGGGHFERRISFGYDADLIQVRAEFDGVMLRIFVPRRISPVNWYPPRPGPIGRA